ncbi:AAA family ATPase [Myxococcota bacterium]|nr:AAA family ATPase [Myxococcota bacterium]
MLKQTLEDPRRSLPITLEGFVDAFSLRELTTGWPAAGAIVPGPGISLEWEFLKGVSHRPPDDRLDNVSHHKMRLELEFSELFGQPQLAKFLLSEVRDSGTPTVLLSWPRALEGEENLPWARLDTLVFDHVIPYMPVVPGVGLPLHDEITLSLSHLRNLLTSLKFLSAKRDAPPSLFKSSSVDPKDIGLKGELAAQLLHRRQHDMVHYPMPLDATAEHARPPTKVREAPLLEAVNDIFKALSVTAPLSIDTIRDIGFRVLFGNASLPHVGQGLASLLPVVELGLLSDPYCFSDEGGDLSLDDYNDFTETISHLALEEPEGHLHPKVQSLLTHWLVSLAMASRRLIVETHSDHMVRRLRGLVARAGAGSELEKWLLENVVIIEVEQDAQGRSTVHHSRLTATGSLAERWPADFMDEASDEDTAIFYAGLQKTPEGPPAEVEHDVGDEPEDAP